MQIRYAFGLLLLLSMACIVLSRCNCKRYFNQLNRKPIRKNEISVHQQRQSEHGTRKEQPSAPKEYRNYQDYVTEHNRYRDMLSRNEIPGQPRARNLRRMVLSWDLVHKARAMAMRCTFKHEGSGENLFATTGKTDPLKAWFDEHKKYRFTPIRSYDLAMYGHYTQMVWADTTSVGCYKFRCPVLSLTDGSQWRNADYTVCKYFPPGNYFKQLPYERA